MYSSISPGRPVKPVIQPISWLGPATNPSRDIENIQSTFPAAVRGSVSFIRRLLQRAHGLQSGEPRAAVDEQLS